jgi:hypothetical protein
VVPEIRDLYIFVNTKRGSAPIQDRVYPQRAKELKRGSR